MPAYFEAVAVRAQMIRIVDHPGRQPEDFALQRGQAGEFILALYVPLPAEAAFDGAQHHLLPVMATILADPRQKILAPPQSRW